MVLFLPVLILLAVPMCGYPLSCRVILFPCPYSDHCAVLLSVTVPDVVPPGPGLWKLNI